jgi:hypothetical protein
MLLSRILRYSGLGLLLFVLAVGPFFQGLFFWTELLAAIVLVSVGFCLWLVGRRLGGLPSGIPGGAPGWALLALLGCYLLQFAWAVYPRGNIDWVLRVAAAWFAYVMVRAESGPGLRRWLSWTFVLSAAEVGFVGFLEYSGYLLKDPSLGAALSVVGLSDRMFTVFQYPNTAAVYFLAAIFAALGLGLEDLRAWKLSLVGGLMTFLALAFFFTISRGAMVVLPFGLIVLFAGLDREKRWPALLMLGAAVVPMVVAMGRVGLFSASHNDVSAFKWISAATVGGAVGGLVLAYFVRLRGRVQVGLVGAALVIGVAGILVLRPAGGLVPKQAARLFDMNFQTQNVVLRLIYDQDAARIVRDHPLGQGGWGWERSYRLYQAFSYTARETHDHYAQTAVEAGVPGLLALLAAVGGALWAAWRSRKENSVGWSMAAGAALIAGHSAIDFDLSYGVVWLLLWIPLAASASESPAAAWRWERPTAWGALAATLGVAGLTASLFAGSQYSEQAVRLATQGQAAASVAAARQAARFDRWDSAPLLLVGDESALERAAGLDPQSAKVQWNLAVARQREQDLPGAQASAQAAVVADPFVSGSYEKAASLAGLLMVDALHDGQRGEAVQRANEILALEAELTRRQAKAAPMQALWKQAQKLTISPTFQFRIGEALVLAGRPDDAEPLLKQAAKVGLLGSEAEIFLYNIYERRGDTKAMKALETKPWVRFRNQNPVYKTLQTW